MDDINQQKAVAFTHLPLANYDELLKSINTGSIDTWIKNEWEDSILSFDKCNNVSLVYLFYSQAYQSYVCNIESAEDDANNEIKIAVSLDNYINSVCKNPSKFQFVGLNQLRPLLNELKLVAKNKGFSLNNLLLGGGSNLFYDCPKIPEAFIRIARRGRNEPILRFDADVYVDENSVALLINKWQEQIAANKKYFFFSGSYFYHDINREKELFYLNDYSVRTHFISSDLRGEDYEMCDDNESEFHIDSDMCLNFIRGLSHIGATPAGQPISGAGLCISPLAITQFPPFANMSKNIVWIDDNIKRFLHEGVNDLSLDDVSMVDGAKFKQNRYPNGIRCKDLTWAKQHYIPRLILGCIIHSVIHLPAIADGPYSKAVQKYMSSSEKPGTNEIKEWIEAAKTRVSEIEKEWSSDKYDRAPGKLLSDASSRLLKIDVAGDSLLEEFLTSPSTINISELCEKYGFPDSENAASYIASSVQDLLNYFDLLDIWPYIIRTIEFATRHESRDYNWIIKKVS